jgi:hypothetical protein
MNTFSDDFISFKIFTFKKSFSNNLFSLTGSLIIADECYDSSQS